MSHKWRWLPSTIEICTSVITYRLSLFLFIVQLIKQGVKQDNRKVVEYIDNDAIIKYQLKCMINESIYRILQKESLWWQTVYRFDCKLILLLFRHFHSLTNTLFFCSIFIFFWHDNNSSILKWTTLSTFLGSIKILLPNKN